MSSVGKVCLCPKYMSNWVLSFSFVMEASQRYVNHETRHAPFHNGILTELFPLIPLHRSQNKSLVAGKIKFDPVFWIHYIKGCLNWGLKITFQVQVDKLECCRLIMLYSVCRTLVRCIFEDQIQTFVAVERRFEQLLLSEFHSPL